MAHELLGRLWLTLPPHPPQGIWDGGGGGGRRLTRQVGGSEVVLWPVPRHYSGILTKRYAGAKSAQSHHMNVPQAAPGAGRAGVPVAGRRENRQNANPSTRATRAPAAVDSTISELRISANPTKAPP